MPTLNLSPSVRSAVLVFGVVVAAVIPILVTAGIPLVVTSIAGAVVAALIGLGLVPPQVSGTQVGVIEPSVTPEIEKGIPVPSTSGTSKANPPDAAEPDQQIRL